MKFLIVDDHPAMLEGLSALLGQAFAPLTSVLAANADEAFAALRMHDDLDIVVLDLNMPGLGGMSAIAEFGHRRADLPIVVVSSSEDARDVRKAMAFGALGYVAKSANQHALTAAIRLVLDGNVYVPPFMLKEQAPADAAETRSSEGVVRLTPRQIEILAMLGRGEPNKVIADQLDIAEKTVKVHVTAIFKILNVVNRTQAAAAGRAAGLI